MRLILLNAMVVQLLLYGVEVCGFEPSIGDNSLNFLSYQVFRNRCASHRGTSNVMSIQESIVYAIINCQKKLGVSDPR